MQSKRKQVRAFYSAARLLAGLAVVTAAAVMAAGGQKPPALPDLGPNVLVFDPAMPQAAMQAQIDKIYAVEQHSEFGPARYALLFLPGEYHVDVPVGFYTQVLGLGATPDAVHITGKVHADASARNNNATTTFWRAAEGFSVTPAGGTMQWAVSQAVPFRRMHVRGNMVLHQQHGWASGGWMADTLVDGNVDSGTQQQWISRNSEWGSWTGSNWNMVFVGVPHPPAGDWPKPPYTKVDQTPTVREKPFLQVDAKGRWSVRVPALAANSAGITWRGGSTPGRSIALSRFYIARPDRDTAASINAQLARGRNLLLTPGIYDLTEPIRVTRANTVVMGLGFATLRPVSGAAAMTTADADGIEIAALLFDAGVERSPVLLEVGPEGSKASHAKNPIVLHDVFFRVGGAGVGRAQVNLRINSSGTIVDHTWIWRADHGSGVGWTSNTSDNGLVVNGDRVTIYGLFVEHHQQFQVLWNGNAGRTYFYQSEIPYDPPDQPSYTSAPGTNGWASYKVADTVTSHEAWGLGIYSVFRHPNVVLSRAIEVPRKPGIRFHHMMTIALDDKGEISNVIDDKGGPTSITPRTTPRVAEFP
ncbi:MAG: coagulation factor 5/8 type domain-containing protein [Acidobacteriota bacterium]|nr:coagulation factor 5/8 type domain-containing protein [Acidobacteriota bacterium]